MEIDETKLPESLFVTGEDGTKSLDYSKIKTQADVDAVMAAKDHVKNDFNAYKEKYKDIDLNKYNTLLANELEQNKEVLDNPVYKNLQSSYNDLQTRFTDLEKQIADRDAKIFDDELRNSIRTVKGVQETAIDDLLFRVKSQGFSKTEKGILNKDGKTIENYLDSIRSSAPHLFKRTVGPNNANNEQLQNAIKTGSLADILANAPTKFN